MNSSEEISYSYNITPKQENLSWTESATNSLGVNVTNATQFIMNMQFTNMELYLTSATALFYATPILVVIGLVTNIISLVVFLGTKMRNSTAGHYLAALAIADSLELLAEFLIWLSSDRFNIGLVQNFTILCKGTFYIRYSSKLLSSLVTCIITIERFILVAFPLKVAVIMTTKVAKINIALTTVVAFGLSLYAVFTLTVIFEATSGSNVCAVVLELLDLYNILLLAISTGIGDFLACILIFIFTALIIYKLVKASRDRKGTVANKTSKSKNKESQITVMLLTVAISFLVLKIPYIVVWSLRQFSFFPVRKITIDTFYLYSAIVNFTYILTVMNHAVNFFLYCVSGTTFRDHLKSLCCARCISKHSSKQSVRGKTTSQNLSSSSNSVVKEQKKQANGKKTAGSSNTGQIWNTNKVRKNDITENTKF